MAWASEQVTGSAVRKAVLYAIANHANKDGLAVLRIETICEEAEIGPTAAKNALSYLTDEAHLIKRERKRRQDGSLGCYEFQLHLGTRGVSSPEALETPNVSSPGTRGVPQEPGKSLEPVVPTEDGIGQSIQQVQEAWRSHSPPLIAHRDAYFSTNRCQSAVKRALVVYPVDDLVAAIVNYATVLGGAEYRWSHSWPMEHFLVRGLDRFVPEAQPLEVFAVRSHGQSQRRVVEGIDRL